MPDNVCVGETKNYQVNPTNPPGSTYTWTIDGVVQPTTGNKLTVTWTEVGTFYITVQEHSADGCDGELRDGYVYVHPPSVTNLDTTVCASEIPFDWNGQQITAAGKFIAQFKNVWGCDSVVNLTVFVNQGVHTYVDVTECKEYTWTGGDGVTYTESGTHDYYTTNANGCQDTVTLNLTINNGVHTYVDVTECKEYTWTGGDGQTYSTSGTYDYYTTNANGCQDTVTLNLTINNGQHTYVDVTECKEYTWTSGDGQTYSTSGTYDYYTTNANGCQDTVTLNLTINNGVHTYVDVTECKEYTWTGGDGVTYTESGTHDYYTTNANGCQDTVTLNLTINNGVHTYVDVTECKEYTWTGGDGQTYSTSGTYDYYTTNANGCQDTVTLNLTINNGQHTYVDVTECKEYTWTSGDGQTYSTSGTYDYYTTNANGCQDTVTLNLTINNGQHTYVDVTECKEYTWTGGDGQTYSTSGTYDYYTTNANGCQDTVTLNLTINNGVHTYVDVTECKEYTWTGGDGQTYSTSGTYDYYTTNANGCQDTVTLNLTINNGQHTYVDVTECKEYTWTGGDGQTYSTSGTYDYYTTNANGCQDTLTLNLTINNGVHTYVDVTECKEYTWTSGDGVTYTESGTHDYYTTNANGCQDTVTLNLTINNGQHTYVDVTECKEYTWTGGDGVTYTESGTHDYYTTNANGCQDTITLNLTINNGQHTYVDVTECKEYTWTSGDGVTYTESGTHDYYTTNANGCQDTVTLNLTINNGQHTYVDVTECKEYTWTGGDGVTYTESGTHDYYTTNANGCQDTVTLNLTINNGVHTYVDVTECKEYTWTGGDGQTYSTSGTYDYYTTNANGCQDTVTLNLTINNGQHTYVDVTECKEYTWTSGDGQTYSTSGTYDYYTTNANGCQDTVTLNLTINNGQHTYVDVTECKEYTWTSGDGQTYSTSGTYDYYTTNANGCQDTVTLNLTINNGQHTYVDVTECKEYTWTGGDGQTYTESGTHDYYTTNANGCQDTITLNLTINNGQHTYVDVTECKEYTWTSGDGVTYTESGTHDYYTTNANGCQDTVTLNLTINNGVHTYVDVTECKEYTWTGGDGQTYSTSGTYDYYSTNANGCQDTVTLNLTINNGQHTYVDVTECKEYTWTGGDGQTYTESGTHDYYTTNANGCQDTVTLNLTINNGQHTYVDVTECKEYTWTGGDGVTYTESGTHDYYTTNANGCQDTITLNLTINNGQHTYVDVTECKEYTWTSGDGVTYTESGTHDYYTTNANGCQDTVTLNLTINNGVHTYVDVTECKEYTWTSGDGVTYTESGTHDYYTTNANGCQDTVTLNLTINNGQHTYVDVTECKEYTWTSGDGVTYTESGTHDYYTTNANGCQDTVTLNLTINNGVHTYVDVTECKEYTWTGGDGQTYSTSGTYDYYTTNANGCQDTVTLNLTINNGQHTYVDVTECKEYTWTSGDGQTYSTSGTYDYYTTNANGCQDTVTLNLTINNGQHTYVDVTECKEYTWTGGDGVTYSTSGTYDYYTTNANGCQDTVTLNLTINNGQHTYVDVTECKEYTWTSGDGQTYSTSGTYDYYTINANGCQDTVTLRLTINQGVHTYVDVTECKEYTWTGGDGVTYSTSGTYDYYTTNANGCQDTVTLNLTINNGQHTYVDVTECKEYTWTSGDGQTYSTSGTYDYYTTNANGCQDTVTLNLTINNGQHTYVDVTECKEYTWTSGDGQTYSTSGTYDYYTTNANGCQDTITLNLTINNGQHTYVDVTECKEYTWTGGDGVTYTESGTHDYYTTNANGCQDTVTLNLTINNGQHTYVDVTECKEYTWTGGDGVTYTESGTHDYYTTNANGCQDTITLNLTINNGQHTYVDVTECKEYTWTSGDGVTYTESGTHDYYTTNANGCQDTVTLNLTINNGQHTYVDVTECKEYTWTGGDGVTYTESGTHDYYTTNANGCQDTVTLNLTINNGVHTYVDVTECKEYTWTGGDGQTYSTSGTYDYYTTNANGCQDTVTLNLTINNGQHTYVDVTECKEYTWTGGDGQTYTESGTHDYYTTNANGCQDTVTLNLTINNGQHTYVDVTECKEYTWTGGDGVTYTESGTHDYYTTNANGCQDTITLNLTINNGQHTYVDVTECKEYTWTSGDGVTYTESGTHDYYTTNANGCQDTVTLNLTINNGVHTYVDVTECKEYTWTGGDGVTYTESGTHDYYTTNANGCQDTVTLNLTINNGVHTYVDVTECKEYTWTGGDGQTYSTSGTYDYYTTNANGCQDTVTLNLTINNGQHTYVDVTECKEYTWTSGDGQTYSTSGTYDYYTTNANGCQDTVTLNLTINNGVHTYVDVTECKEYTWTSGDGVTYTESGTHDYYTTNANGCQDTVTLNLTINNGVHTYVDVTECKEYTWTGGDGQTYSTSGTYDYYTTNANGCQDTVTLNLTINNGQHTYVDVTECKEYTWTGGDGQTYSTSGTYDYYTTNANGCQDTLTLNLTINNGVHTYVDVTECKEYTWTSGDGVTYTESGTHDYYTTNANGCQDTVTLNLTINNGQHTYVDVTECKEYTWTGGDGVTYTESGTHDYYTTNANGCQDTVTLNLTINNGQHTYVDVTECKEYTWTGGDGVTYTESGTHDYYTTNANGCQDTLTLNLTINNGVHTYVDVTECKEYTWTSGDGVTYTESGTHDYYTTNANGCRDTVTLNLTINNGVHTYVDVTECKEYTWTSGDGQTYSTSGAYDYYSTNANGCQDTLTLNLTINNGVHTYVDVTECKEYTWTSGDGQTYTESGTHDYYTTNANGCQDTLTLNLTINNGQHTYVDVTECKEYTWTGGDGVTYTESGTHDYYTTNANGCQDTLTLNLTINNGQHTYVDVTECKEYTWTSGDGVTYTESGTHDYYTTNANGCQDTVTLNLTINNGVHTYVDVTECKEYRWTGGDGVTYTESGTHDYYTTNANGCQDTLTLNLTINNGQHTYVDVTECKEYTWTGGDGQTYSTSGTYDYYTTNANGCQDTVTLNLTINNGVHTYVDVTECKEYTWTGGDGQTYSTSGTYDYYSTNANGCQDTVTLNLTINNGQHTYVDVTECKEYTWTGGDGQTYTESGTHDYYTTNANGCQDTVTLNLTINNGQHTYVDVTECKEYTWTGGDGVTYTESGTHDYYTTNANGCQDTITLNLTINNGQHTYVDVTECKEYTWTSGDGVTYTESGTHDYYTTNANGCQDTVTLNLTINNGQHTYVDVTECKEYTWTGGDGVTYTESGTHDYYTTNANGCQDTVTLNLTINNGVHTYVDVTECKEYTWTGGDGQTYSTSGTYDYYTTNANGCQDTVTLNLTINNGQHTYVDVTECKEYTWTSGDGQTYSTSGTYDYYTTNANGCQDTVTLNLTINNGQHTYVDVTECKEYTWTGGDGVTYSTSGTYDYYTTNANGCQDTVTLNLTINNGQHTYVDVTECKEYTWTSGDGQTYSTSGTYDYYTINANGCQDTVTLRLTINQGVHTYVDVTECKEYTWTGGDGVTYSTSGTYDYYTTNANGCQDTVTLNLTINNGQHTYVDVTECKEYTWTSGDGQTYSTSGTYDYYTTNANGCQDTVTLNLTINNGQHTYVDVTECKEYTWTSGDGQTYSTSGTYDYYTTNANGCQDTITLNLTINNGQHTYVDVTECKEYTWTGGDGVTYTESGTHDYYTTNANGCQDTVTLNLTINNGQHTYVDVTECKEYTWTSGDGQTYSTTGTYDYYTTNANGCQDTVTLNLTINQGVPTTAEATQPTCETAGVITVTSPVGSDYEYSIDGTNFQSSPVFNGVSAGSYTVTVRSVTNAICTSTTTVTVNAAPGAVTVTAEATQPTCETAGVITVTAPVGSDYEYSIDGTNFQSSPVFSNVSAGSYTVTVRSVTNAICTSTTTVSVNATPGAVTVTAEATDPTCETAGVITVTAPIGSDYEYSIDGTNFQSSPVFSNVSAGSYTVTVRSVTNAICTSTTTVSVNAAPGAVTVTAEATQPTCETAGVITVTAPVGSDYEYSIDGTNFQSSPVFNGVSAGSYTVTVRSTTGSICTSTGNVVVDAAPGAVTVTAEATDPTCETAGVITVTSPVGSDYEYSIDGTNFQSSPVFNGVGEGSYTVTVRSTTGSICTSTGNVVVDAAPGAVTVTAEATDPTCETAGVITVTSPVGSDYEYSIDGTNFQSSPVFSNVSAGSYTVTVRSITGAICTSTTTVTVNAAPGAVTVTAEATQPTCETAGVITVTSPVGSDYEYSIDGTNFQSSPVFSNVSAGSYTVTVRSVTNAICTSTTTVSVNATPGAVTVTAEATDPTCETAGVITVTAPIGSDYEYSIDGTNFQSSPVFNGVGAGSYTVTVRSVTGAICISTTTVTVNAAPGAVTVTAEATDPTCETAGVITVTSPVGSDYEYSIDGTNFQSSPVFSNVSAGSYTVTVRSITNAICTSTTTVTVNAAPGPVTVTAEATQPTCETAGVITVTSPVGSEYEYSIDGTNFQSSPVFNSVGAGSYTVTVRSITNAICTSTTTVTVNAAPGAVTVTAEATQPTCETAGVITVTSPVGSDYEYSIDGTNFQSSPVFNGVGAGSYTVTVRSTTGSICTSTGSVVVNPAPGAVTVTAEATQPTCETAGMITVTSPVGSDYEYSIDGTNFQSSPVFNGVGEGSYTVTVRSTTGSICTSTGNVVVDAAPGAVTVTAEATDPTCETAGVITVTSPVGSDYEYSIDGTNFQSSPVFSNVSAGSYTVTVRSITGAICTSTTTVTVNAAPGAVTVTAEATDPTCETAGVITVTAPVGSDYEYSIDGTNFQSSPVFNGVSAGSYTVTVRSITNAICTSTTTVTFNAAPGAVTVTAEATQPTCETAGVITVTAPVGSDYEYSIDGTNFQSSPVFNNISAGSYTVTVRSTTGSICTSTGSVVVNEAPGAVTVTAEATQPTCETAGVITVTSPVGSDYEYSIDGTNFQSSPVFNNISAGSYTVTVRSISNAICTSTTTVTVNAAPGPVTVTAEATQPTCEVAGVITVTSPVGSDYEYSIDGTNFQSSPVFNGVSAGSYTVTVRSITNAICTSTTTVTVNAAPGAVTVTAEATQPTCETAGVITVTSPVGSDYEYSIDGTNFQSSPVFNGVSAGSYTVTVRSITNAICTSTTTVTVNAAPGPVTVTAEATQPTCEVAGVITVTAPIGSDYEYSIDGTNFQSSPVFNSVGAGSYTVTVRSITNAICTSTTTVTVNAAPGAVTVTAEATQPTCETAGVITVTSPVGSDYEYSIDGTNFQSSPVFNNISAGSYTVTVRSITNAICTSTTTVTFNAAPGPVTVTAEATQPTCETAGVITVTSPVGSDYEYSIDGTNFQSSPVFNSVGAGSYTVTVRSITNAICTSTTTVTVNAAPGAVTVTAEATQPTCETAGVITVTSPVGSDYEYSIDGTNFQSSPVFNGVSAGSYTVTVRSITNAICTSTTTVTVNAAPGAVTVTAEATQPTCETAGVITVTSPVGSDYEYSIDGTNFQSSPVFNNISAGSYTVTVRSISNAICTSTTTVTVNAAPGPVTVTAEATQPTCEVAGVITVTAPIGSDYEYSIDGTNFQSSPVFNSVGAGSYTVTVRSITNAICTSTTTVTVNAAPGAVTVTAEATQPTCETAGVITVTSPVGSDYEYSIDGTNFQSSPVFNNISAGSYTVTVRSITNAICISTTTVTVNAAPGAVTVTAEATDPTCETAGVITVTAPIGSDYEYSIDGTNFQSSPVFNNISAGSYTVTVRSTTGSICTSTGSVVVNEAPGAVTVTAEATQPTCETAGVITVTAPIGSDYEYSIDGTNFQSSPVFNGVGAGSYTVTVRSTTGSICTSTGSVVVNPAPGAVTVTAEATQPTCETAGVITVTAPIGSDYEYSIDGTNFQSSPVFNNISAGSYTVTVRSTTGSICTSTGSVVVNPAPGAVTVTAEATDPTCETAGVITVTSPVGSDYEYSIDGTNFQSSPVFNNIGAGSYTVTVRSTTGSICTSTGSVVVNPAPGAVTVTAEATQPTCETAGVITVTSPVGSDYEYSIDGTNFQSSPVFSNVSAGSYTVTVRSISNAICTSTTTVTVNAAPGAVTVTAEATQPTCETAGVITVTAPIGSDYEYSIDGTNFQSSPVFNGVGAGSYTVAVRSTTGSICTSTGSVVVNPAPGAVTVTAEATQPTCETAGVITVTSPVGSDYEYSIDGTNFQSSPVFNNISAGSYTVTVRSTTGSICMSTGSVVVNPAPGAVTVTAEATQPTCETAGVITVTSPVGSDYEYSIDGTNFQSSPVFNSVSAGSYTVTVRSITNAICSSTTTVTVNAAPGAVTPVTKDTTVCASALPFTWNGITVDKAGDYPYTTQSQAGCDSTITLHVTVVDAIKVDSDTTVCASALPFTWNGITVDKAGDYPYTTQSRAGCDSTITLHVFTTEAVTVEGDTTVCASALPFTWNGITVDKAGDYPYTTQSQAGCDSTITLHVFTTEAVTVDRDTTVCASALPFTWNGITVDKAGDYPYTTQSQAGCDSTITLHVTVVDVIQADRDTTVCASALPFTWNGITVDKAGDYPFTTQSQAGCDSTITLHVFTTEAVTVDRDTTVCASALPFTWNGIAVDRAGDYPFTTQSQAGCDSTITLHVFTTEAVTVDRDTTVCASALPFTWNGITVDKAGDYPYTTKSQAGCDSTITLHVFTTEAVNVDRDTTVCASALPFTWNGIAVDKAGDYPYTTQSQAGCDSTITLHVTVVDAIKVDRDTTVCASALPFTWNGITVDKAGNYPYTTQSQAGCDSTITLHVFTTEAVTVDRDTTVCASALPFTWNGITVDKAGDYPYTTQSQAGCDSTITLHVAVVDAIKVDRDTTVCASALPFTWNGITVDKAGDYPYTTQSQAGCDSTITLHVFTTEAVTASQDTTVCASALPFTWNGITVDKAGDYPYTTQSQAVCDSTITLHVFTTEAVTASQDTTVCASALPFTWNGITVDKAGDYPYTTQSQAGCDSTITLHVFTTEAVTASQDTTVCASALPFTWNGITVDKAGDYPYTTQSQAGCDSIITLHVFTTEAVTVDRDTTVCASALPFTWNGITVDKAGDYPFTTQSQAGCDSTITLHVTVVDAIAVDRDTTVCASALPFTWNGITVDKAGDYPYTTQSQAGCDSTITLHVFTTEAVTADRDTTICASALPFTWNGITVDKAGDYPYTTQSQAGCDSTITLHVLTTEAVTVDRDTTVCASALPFTWNGITVDKAGDYPFTTQSQAGCDSTITLHVTVVDAIAVDRDTTVCASALPFTWNGITVDKAGDYPYTTQSQAGCDSTITLHVFTTEAVTADRDTTICASALPFTWNGITVDKAGDYPYTTQSQAGCDSTITLHVLTTEAVTVDRDTTVCASALPFTWNGITVDKAGDYPYTTQSQAGCDSTITLHVLVENGAHTDTTVIVCESYTWNRTGETYTNSGVYDYVFANGLCNDTITLHLTINQPSYTTVNDTICANEVPYTWNGATYTTGGTFVFTTKNAAGCDSVVTLNLLVLDNLTGPTDSVTMCENALPFQWNGLTITSAGTYTVTLQSSAGCDSTVTLVLATSPQATATITGGNPICKGESTTVSIVLTGTAPWTLTYTDGNGTHTISGIMSSPYELNVAPTTTTTYSLLTVDDAKCSNYALNSSVTVNVVESVSGVRYPDVTARANVAKQLEARDLGSNYKYNWAPPDGLNFTDIRTPVFKYDRSVEYLISITPNNGCRVVDTLRVLIPTSAPGIRSSLHVPNAWSPNNDGHNDKLFPLTINISELYYFRVFNRWGQLVFETNVLGQGWDGVYNGKPQVSDVYTWTVEAMGMDGVHYKQSGNALLLR